MTLKPDRKKARNTHSKRSKRARATDEALRARKAKSYEEWKRDPSRFDIQGVDTPKAKTTPKKPVKPVHSKPEPPPRKKRLSAKKKAAIAKYEEDQKRYRFADSTGYLILDRHPGPNDFVVVKTVPTSIDQTTRYNKPRTLVMRTRDSKLYQIGTAELNGYGIPTTAGQKFTLRRISETGYDKDTKMVFKKVE